METDDNKLPCEDVVCELMGTNWRFLPDRDKSGAWGVAIVWSVLSGQPVDLGAIAEYLGVNVSEIKRAFSGLKSNRAFDTIESDRQSLESMDKIAWLYYAGYASGHTRRAVIGNA